MASGRKIYDYLAEERTRLYPAVAFEADGLGLLQLVGALPTDPRALSEYENQLKSDVDAIVLVRIPQIPSSRAMGSSPVFSFDEYRSRVPADRAKWKVGPSGGAPVSGGVTRWRRVERAGTVRFTCADRRYRGLWCVGLSRHSAT